MMTDFTKRLSDLLASGVREFDVALADIASKETYMRALDRCRNWPGNNEVGDMQSAEQNATDNRAAWNSTARYIRETYADVANASKHPLAILADARKAISAATANVI